MVPQFIFEVICGRWMHRVHIIYEFIELTQPIGVSHLPVRCHEIVHHLLFYPVFCLNSFGYIVSTKSMKLYQKTLC